MEKPFLLFKDLEPERGFKPFVLTITKEFVRKFCEVVEDRNPIYFDKECAKREGFKNPVAPTAIAGIYGRRSYLEEYRMPPGGILAQQEFEFLKPVYVDDTITAYAKVIERYEKETKKYVKIETIAKNQNGEVIGIVKLKLIWPE